jgi:hypothetical protein
MVAGLTAIPIVFALNLLKGDFTPEVFIGVPVMIMPFAIGGLMIGFQIGPAVLFGAYVWAALATLLPAIDERKGLWAGAACFGVAGTAYVYPTWLKSLGPILSATGAFGFAGGFIFPRLLFRGLEPGSMVLWVKRN